MPTSNKKEEINITTELTRDEIEDQRAQKVDEMGGLLIEALTTGLKKNLCTAG